MTPLAKEIHEHLELCRYSLPLEFDVLSYVFRAHSDDCIRAALAELAVQGMAIEDADGWRWHQRPAAIKPKQEMLFA